MLRCLDSIFIRCFELFLIKSFFEPGWYHFESQALIEDGRRINYKYDYMITQRKNDG